MNLPVVMVVDDPAVANPDHGTFVRLTRRFEFITDLGFSVWTFHLQSLIGGVLMPHEVKLTEIRIDEVIAQLHRPEMPIKYIYLTHEAAEELLPLMTCPQVPFALPAPNPELRLLCLSQLRMNLRLGN